MELCKAPKSSYIPAIDCEEPKNLSGIKYRQKGFEKNKKVQKTTQNVFASIPEC
jgi:hypothetical protein